jgi:hypothetical protein
MLTSAWLNELISSNERCLAVVQAIDYITRLIEVHDQASQTFLGGKCMSLLGSISSDKGRRAVQVALTANWNSPLILHSDNGGSMKGATMLATLQKLGVMASLSRPAVSNDNPYSESLFKNAEISSRLPAQGLPRHRGRPDLGDHADRVVQPAHRHSAIRFVTPAQQHGGLDTAILQRRSALYASARAKNPRRWTERPTGSKNARWT